MRDLARSTATFYITKAIITFFGDVFRMEFEYNNFV
jgi:hypothetical protein